MAKKEKVEGPKNKIKQAEYREVMRSEIHPAAYNPRKITPEARKLLKDNLKRVGLMGGLVFNENTGNLVGGHQKLDIMDEVNKYNADTMENDYPIRVEVVKLSEKEEVEQNLFLNNKNAQGTFDDDLLRDILSDTDMNIDYAYAGLDEFDVQMLGLGEPIEVVDAFAEQQWRESQVTGTGYEAEEDAETDEEMAAKSEEFKQGGENTKIDRSVNFYEDTPENQLARHAEIQKIKDRIVNQNDIEKDNGALSYVVLSFRSPSETDSFLDMFGYPFGTKYIQGSDFLRKLEFGPESEDEE